jgi:uncharacterized protein (TIGR02391 family)
LLQSEMNIYPISTDKDPMIQLKWLDGAISKLNTIVNHFPSIKALHGDIKLHPKVVEVSEHLLVDGHFSQAIFEAFKALEEYIRNKTGIHNKYGTNLMAQVFNENNAILTLKPSHSLTAKEEQEGFKLIFMGAMLAIKDPKSHTNINLQSRERALLYLSLASLLFEKVDESS